MHMGSREVGEGLLQSEHPPSFVIVITIAMPLSVQITVNYFHMHSLL